MAAVYIVDDNAARGVHQPARAAAQRRRQALVARVGLDTAERRQYDAVPRGVLTADVA